MLTFAYQNFLTVVLAVWYGLTDEIKIWLRIKSYYYV